MSNSPKPCKVDAPCSDEPLYRVLDFDYRIFYLIEDARLLVVVVKIGPRSSVYN